MSGIATRTIGRMSTLLTGAMAAAGLSFAIQFVLSRNLEVASYGRIVAMLAVANILAPLASWGVAWMWIQLYGGEGWHARRWIAVSLRMMGLSSLAAMMLTAAYVVATQSGSPWEQVAAALAAILVMLGQSQIETVTARLQLEERHHMLAVWQLFNPGARIVAIVALLMAGFRDPASILAGLAAVGAVTGLIGLLTISQLRQGAIKLAGHGDKPTALATQQIPSLRQVFNEALPYVLQGVVFLIASQGVVAIVETVLGPRDAGLYNVAFVLMSAVYLAPTVIYTKYLGSKIFRWWVHERAMFNAAFHLGMAAQLALGLAAMATVMVAAPALVSTIFGERYNDAVPVVRILAIALPIRFVLFSMAAGFYSRQHILRKVIFGTISAAVTVGLAVALAPTFGLTGAAVSVVLGDTLLLLFYTWGAHRYIEGITPWFSLRPTTLKESLHYVFSSRTALR